MAVFSLGALNFVMALGPKPNLSQDTRRERCKERVGRECTARGWVQPFCALGARSPHKARIQSGDSLRHSRRVCDYGRERPAALQFLRRVAVTKDNENVDFRVHSTDESARNRSVHVRSHKAARVAREAESSARPVLRPR